MIQLFVLDIDGCVTFPFETPPWDAITGIRELNQQSRHVDSTPAITLCTGRPFPYTEAVAQYLDIRFPYIFESGGGLFDPVQHELFFSPDFDDRAKQEKEAISEFVEQQVLPDYNSAHLEFTKYTDVGIVGNNPEHIRQMYEKIREWVEPRYSDVEVHTTEVSVNVIRKSCNKGEGIKQISNHTGIPLENIAYIGDSSGDLTAIRKAGFAVAPANAIQEVKAAVDKTMEGEATRGVWEAYQFLAERNLMRSESV